MVGRHDVEAVVLEVDSVQFHGFFELLACFDLDEGDVGFEVDGLEVEGQLAAEDGDDLGFLNDLGEVLHFEVVGKGGAGGGGAGRSFSGAGAVFGESLEAFVDGRVGGVVVVEDGSGGCWVVLEGGVDFVQFVDLLLMDFWVVSSHFGKLVVGLLDDSVDNSQKVGGHSAGWLL